MKVPSSVFLFFFFKKTKIKWLTDDGSAKQSGLESQGVKIENTALVSLKGWVVVGVDY